MRAEKKIGVTTVVLMATMVMFFAFGSAYAKTQLLTNNNFEQGTTGWGAGGSGLSPTFVTAPWAPYSGSYMARAQASTFLTAGTMWIWSPLVNVAGNVDVRGSVFVRSNMKNLRIDIHERDSSGREIRNTPTANFTPPLWQWYELKFKVTLLPNCAQVFIAVAGVVQQAGVQYLDIDLATLYSNRASYGAHSVVTYYGVTAHVNKLKELGSRFARFGVPWFDIEAVQGTYNWTTLDTVINTLYANGIQPLLLVHGNSPQWANGSTNTVYSTNHSYVPPGNTDAYWVWRWHYGEFVKKLVARYKAKVKYWEVGNEPNIAEFWAPAPDIWQFSTWASDMQQKIKDIDSTAVVAVGGLTVLNQDWGGGQISGKDFLHGMYDNNFFPDIVSVHPYCSDFGDDPYATPGVTGKNRFRDVETIRGLMLAHDQPNQPTKLMWITEMGWQVGATYDGVTMTEALQRQYLEQATNVMDGWSYVRMFIWFWDWDTPILPELDGFGLARTGTSGVLRPAGTWFRDWVGK